MKCRIIIIGDEILMGQVTDTNSGVIARALDPQGWEIDRVETVGDSRPAIERAVRTALDGAALVMVTGGLGPTKDDITKGVLCDIFGGPMVRDEAVLDNVRRVFNLRGLSMNALTEGQAMVPASCTVIQNRYGTAPVMWFETPDGRVLVSMPGVPFETEGMLPEVTDRIQHHFAPDIELMHHSLMVSGITESALAERLAGFEAALDPTMHLAYLPTPGLIRLRLDGRDRRGNGLEPRFTGALERLRAELGPLMVYDGDASSARIAVERLRAHGLTLATAESCTGGTIASRITAVPGCSDIYTGGVVSYANAVKEQLLGVPAADIESQGAVSRPVVEAMAAGACRACGARCACAPSGIAGPDGGTPDKPVGTVWIGWCVDGRVSSRLFHFPGNRARVIDRAATEALLGLVNLIQ